MTNPNKPQPETNCANCANCLYGDYDVAPPQCQECDDFSGWVENRLITALSIADKALGIIETASQSKKSMKGTAATARRRILEVLR